MDLGLAGKAVLVTGGSRGIGLGIVREFLAEGADVALTARSADGLETAGTALAQEFPERTVAPLQGDMREAADVERCVAEARERLGGLDVAVANVGRGRGPTESSVPLDDWQEMLAENLHSSVLLCQEAARAMADGGSLVLIGSIAGLEFHPAPLPYSVSKAALVRYTRDLARRLAPDGIRVNLVAPGNVIFPGGSWAERREADPEGIDRRIRQDVPMARFGTPEEVAAAAVFLSSERSSFTTGACLVVDGGQYRG